MLRSPRTKKQLLTAIRRGKAAVEHVATTAMFRVSVPGDGDPNSGVWIVLAPSHDYIVDDYRSVYARVGKRNLRLSRAEADAMRLFVARTMRGRGYPPRSSPAR